MTTNPATIDVWWTARDEKIDAVAGLLDGLCRCGDRIVHALTHKRSLQGIREDVLVEHQAMTSIIDAIDDFKPEELYRGS